MGKWGWGAKAAKTNKQKKKPSNENNISNDMSYDNK